MRAGQLDRRITIERATYSTNDFNEHVPTWVTLATVWAAVSYRSVDEGMAGQRVTPTLATRFVVRWSSKTSGITPKDRITFEGKTYEIIGVYEQQRRRGVEIHAVAGAA